ncbi:MAG: serine hydrolase domain-containing protein [Pseudomonadota bacterium]
MKSRPLSVLLAGLTLGGCASPAPEPPSSLAPGDYSHVRAYGAWLAKKEMKQHGVVGLSIALVDDQRVVWSQGFGYADLAARRPADANTLYRVGSVSKLFTTAAALNLAERGRLNLDAPLADYLPGFTIQPPGGGAPVRPDITLRQLATHHAGLPRDLAGGMWGRDVKSPDSLVPALATQAMLMPPGRAYAYSNLGISLLGEAVARAAGRPFAEEVQATVLAPLGLEHARFSTQVPDEPWMSRSYRLGKEARDHGLRDIAAGGLVASAMDLARFMSMILAEGGTPVGRALRADSVQEMTRPQFSGLVLDVAPPTALGWHLGHPGLEQSERVLVHDGSTGLFHASVVLLPEARLGVAVLANSDAALPVVNRLAVETLVRALAAKTGRPLPARAVLPDGPPLEAAQRRDYLGWWTTEQGAVRIVEKGDGLRAELGDKQLRLTPRADGLLRLDYRLFGLFSMDLGEMARVGLSRRDIEGIPRLVARVGGLSTLAGSRVEPSAIPAPWRARLGEYRLAETEGPLKSLGRARLLEEDGLLFVEMEQDGERGRIILRPLDDHRALLLGRFAEYGELVEAEAGGRGPATLVYSGLHFVRREDGDV